MNVHSSKHKCTGRGGSDALKVHRRIHSLEKPFECAICSKRSTTLCDLVYTVQQTVERIHSGEKPYKCHLCDKAFTQSVSLHNHMRETRESSLCNKSFTQSSYLQTHNVFTEIEDLMSVLTVGSCLNVAVI